MKKRTFCNPVNINYRYQRYFFGRESADPLVLIYHGTYFLFASHGEGYWISDDLVKWDFIKVDIKKYPDFELYAPGTCVVGDRLYVTFSQGGNILYSDDPFDPGSWINIGRPYEWHDPAFLYGDDGYVYVYEGLGDRCLHASKLDPRDNMRLVEGPVPIFYSDTRSLSFSSKQNPYVFTSALSFDKSLALQTVPCPVRTNFRFSPWKMMYSVFATASLIGS